MSKRATVGQALDWWVFGDKQPDSFGFASAVVKMDDGLSFTLYRGDEWFVSPDCKTMYVKRVATGETEIVGQGKMVNGRYLYYAPDDYDENHRQEVS